MAMPVERPVSRVFAITWVGRTSLWAWLAVIALLLALSWSVVFSAGGTQTAWPHVFYLPIVLAALPFGRKGGVGAGLAATLLCGPLIPLDTAAGVAQGVANWATRGGFFVAVGLLAGATVDVLRRSLTDSVVEQVEYEIALATAASRPPDVAAGRRIRGRVSVSV
jgi:hypothetical protein